MVILLCAGAGAFAVTQRAHFTGAPASRMTAPPSGTRSHARGAKRKQVLIQSYPEGAKIYIAGRLESVGVTPMWVTMELEDDVPGRIMLRKTGYQDKAVAIEQERPPIVTLLALEPDEAPAPEVPRKRPEKKVRSVTVPAPSPEAPSVEPPPVAP